MNFLFDVKVTDNYKLHLLTDTDKPLYRGGFVGVCRYVVNCYKMSVHVGKNVGKNVGKKNQ